VTLYREDAELTVVTFELSLTNETWTKKLGGEVRARDLLGGHLLPFGLCLRLDDMGDMGGSRHKLLSRI